MLRDRRTFAAGSITLLSGCATVGNRRPSDCTPLAPVIVDQSRIIRTMAGLRPYRRQGFVVRLEQLGEKRLVHNYGHGGGGNPLRLGPAELRVETGFAGPNGALGGPRVGAVGVVRSPLGVRARVFPDS